MTDQGRLGVPVEIDHEAAEFDTDADPQPLDSHRASTFAQRLRAGEPDDELRSLATTARLSRAATPQTTGTASGSQAMPVRSSRGCAKPVPPATGAFFSLRPQTVVVTLPPSLTVAFDASVLYAADNATPCLLYTLTLPKICSVVILVAVVLVTTNTMQI